MYYNIWAYEGWNQRWKTVLAIHTVVWIYLWADDFIFFEGWSLLFKAE